MVLVWKMEEGAVGQGMRPLQQLEKARDRSLPRSLPEGGTQLC